MWVGVLINRKLVSGHLSYAEEPSVENVIRRIIAIYASVHNLLLFFAVGFCKESLRKTLIKLKLYISKQKPLENSK